MQLNFVCRPSKARKDGLSPIELSIIINSERKVITLDRKINPTHWNSKSQTVKGNKEINTYLQSIKQKLYTTQTELLQHNIPLTISSLLNAYTNGVTQSHTILSIYDTHNKDYQQLVSQHLSTPVTLNKYIKAREYLYKYIKDKYNKEDIDITQITPQFIENHYLFLLQYMQNNSALKIMKRLKRIIQIALDEGFIKVNPWKFKGTETPTNKRPLSNEEIEKIKSANLFVDRLNKVRDLFLFQCYTGLAYADMKNLKESDIQDNMIVIYRQKTKIKTTVPLLSQAKEILEKYNYKLPIISNQRMNSYLKDIQVVTRITSNITSHIARHTFASLLINNNVPLPVISRCLGHSNSRITEKTYAKLSDATVMNEVMKVANVI